MHADGLDFSAKTDLCYEHIATAATTIRAIIVVIIKITIYKEKLINKQTTNIF